MTIKKLITMAGITVSTALGFATQGQTTAGKIASANAYKALISSTNVTCQQGALLAAQVNVLANNYKPTRESNVESAFTGQININPKKTDAGNYYVGFYGTEEVFDLNDLSVYAKSLPASNEDLYGDNHKATPEMNKLISEFILDGQQTCEKAYKAGLSGTSVIEITTPHTDDQKIKANNLFSLGRSTK
jgi:hypothetical protein